MNGILMFRFLLNWTPKWFHSGILNCIMSLVTKTKIYRKSSNFNAKQYSFINQNIQNDTLDICNTNHINILAAFDTGFLLNRGFTAKENLAQHYLEKMNDENVDLIIFPASLVPAPKRVCISLTKYNGSHTYTSVVSESYLCFVINFQDYQFYSKVPMACMPYIAWNIFDFPAGILPVSMVTQDDENEFLTNFPNNDLVRSNITAKNECLLIFSKKY